MKRRLDQRRTDHRGRAQGGGSRFHRCLLFGKNARFNRAAEKPLALLESVADAVACGDDLIRTQRDCFRGFERTLHRIEHRLLQIDASVHGFVGVKKLDAHRLASNRFTINQRHRLGVQQAREFLVFIVAGQKHAVHLAPIRQ